MIFKILILFAEIIYYNNNILKQKEMNMFNPEKLNELLQAVKDEMFVQLKEATTIEEEAEVVTAVMNTASALPDEVASIFWFGLDWAKDCVDEEITDKAEIAKQSKAILRNLNYAEDIIDYSVVDAAVCDAKHNN